jgi:hypothetical protein
MWRAPAPGAGANAEQRKLVAEQQHDDARGSEVRQREAHPEVELALRDHALHDVEAVAVEHVEERRGDEVERAAHSRVHVRERNAEQRQHHREDRHRHAPEQLGALEVAVEDHQRFGRNRLRRRRQRARFVRLDPPAELRELDRPEVGGTGLALVAPPILEHDEAVAVGHFLEGAGAGDGGDVVTVVDGMQENVANGAVERVDAFDEHDEIRAAELAEQPRRDQHELVARFELPLELEAPPLGPRRQEQRQRDDRDEERRREPEDRFQARGEALARREPDNHLAVPVPSRERHQHRQKQRDGQQYVEIKQRVKAQERPNSLGRHGAARRAG